MQVAPCFKADWAFQHLLFRTCSATIFLNCAFSLTGFVWPSSHQRHLSLTDTVRVVVAGGAGQSDPDDSTTTEASVKTAWTLCDSSGEAFLTRGLATAAPCSASAPAARRCTLELVAEARRGHKRTWHFQMLRKAGVRWLALTGRPVSGALQFPSTSSTVAPVTVPHARKTLGLELSAGLGDVQMLRD